MISPLMIYDMFLITFILNRGLVLYPNIMHFYGVSLANRAIVLMECAKHDMIGVKDVGENSTIR